MRTGIPPLQVPVFLVLVRVRVRVSVKVRTSNHQFSMPVPLHHTIYAIPPLRIFTRRLISL